MPLKGTTFHNRKPAPPITRAPPIWTADQTAELARLWKTGRSMGQIERLMPDRTRSAIAGKLDRLGLIGDGARSAVPPLHFDEAARELGVSPEIFFDEAAAD